MPISPYVCVFVILMVGFMLSRAVPSTNRITYRSMVVLLTLFLAFRYGQGTDYSMYEYFYLAAPDRFDLDDLYFTDAYHTEIGWKLSMVLLKMLGIPFEVFVVILSIWMMYCLDRCVMRHSPDRMLSLLIAFPTLYFIGFFSMLREGFVVAVFLGFLLNSLIQKKGYILYVFVSICLMLIHTVAAVFIVALVITVVFDSKSGRGWLYLICCVCAVCGVLPLLSDAIRSFMANMPFVGFYYRNVEISWLALSERLMWVLILVPLGFRVILHKPEGETRVLSTLINLYIFGFSLYLLFSVSPNIASRFFFPFESMEILLVPLVFSYVSKWKNAVTLLVCCLAVLFVIKNINASIDERDYYPYVSWFNYPYVTIFDDPSDLSLYRPPYPLTGRP